jgi:RHH-type proline utilization regulon transcriptional repressor/proline dehydrogenase/delta 1-pyrroline-5-carboxylate dehydrogenase
VVLAAGSRAVWPRNATSQNALAEVPPGVRAAIVMGDENADVDAVLIAGDVNEVVALSTRLAARAGPIVAVQSALPDGVALDAYVVERLLVERSLSINTAAAGGNASLMTVG